MKFLRCVFRCLPLLLVLLTWSSVDQWLHLPKNISVWLYRILQLILPISFFFYYKYYTNRITIPYIFIILITWFGIEFLAGFFMVEGYLDILRLVENLVSWSLILSIIFFQEPDNITHVTRVWLRWPLLFGLLLIPFMAGEAIGRFLVPFSFIIIFFPYLDSKMKIFCVVSFLIVIFVGSLGARSTILRFTVGLLCGIAIYFNDYISKKIMGVVSLLLMILPFVLLYLAIDGSYNIFELESNGVLQSQEVKGSLNDEQTEDLAEDTRSTIYYEELESAVKNNYMVFGRTFGRGCDVVYSGGFNTDVDWKKGRRERANSEVRILNVLNHSGLVGVIILFFLYGQAVYNALYKSKSKTMIVLGVYVAYRWFFAWIEDFERYDLLNLYLWIPIVMCYSPVFLKMNDTDFKKWAKNIFQKNEASY